jgi:hypothetical protein
MAKIDVKTQVEGPDEIKITLVRQDYLETSNTFRIFFEICLAIGAAILGDIIALLNDGKNVPILNWLFFSLMIIGCIAFLVLSAANYKKAKSQTTAS